MAAHPALAALDQLAPSTRTGVHRWAPPTDLEAAIIEKARAGVSIKSLTEALTANAVPVCEGTIRRWLRDQGAIK